ncbi:regucalcin-like isoform X2 [Odontomachus brunneus]|uniref:regucalcin-like isoform X2 n=1 Tax=Odontomachus brunneus TaxID=486640 RepID=UPI0013F290CF|nr:regucalcin-like isoform X2 [Odontomachus brunneus]
MQVAGDSNVCVEKVTDTYGLSEGPHWDHRSQKLYFVDIYNQFIRRLDPATGVVTNAYIKHGTVGVVIPVDGSSDQLIAGAGKDIVLVTWDGEKDEKEVPTEVLCSVDEKNVKTRINDGKVDSSGRLWLGTMGENEVGNLIPGIGSFYHIDSQNKLCIPMKEISPVSISNGLAWNKEDDTFYYIDSPTRQIAAYDYDPNSGKISNRRIVFNLNTTNLSGVPDGMTIDTDGNLWVALFGGSQVINVNPKTGKILRVVKIPAENVTSATFGGPFLDILYVTTSGHGLTAEQQEKTPKAGALFAVKGLGVRGSLANAFRNECVDKCT